MSTCPRCQICFADLSGLNVCSKCNGLRPNDKQSCYLILYYSCDPCESILAKPLDKNGQLIEIPMQCPGHLAMKCKCDDFNNPLKKEI